MILLMNVYIYLEIIRWIICYDHFKNGIAPVLTKFRCYIKSYATAEVEGQVHFAGIFLCKHF